MRQKWHKINLLFNCVKFTAEKISCCRAVNWNQPWKYHSRDSHLDIKKKFVVIQREAKRWISRNVSECEKRVTFWELPRNPFSGGGGWGSQTDRDKKITVYQKTVLCIGKAPLKWNPLQDTRTAPLQLSNFLLSPIKPGNIKSTTMISVVKWSIFVSMIISMVIVRL